MIHFQWFSCHRHGLRQKRQRHGCCCHWQPRGAWCVGWLVDCVDAWRKYDALLLCATHQQFPPVPYLAVVGANKSATITAWHWAVVGLCALSLCVSLSLATKKVAADCSCMANEFVACAASARDGSRSMNLHRRMAKPLACTYLSARCASRWMGLGLFVFKGGIVRRSRRSYENDRVVWSRCVGCVGGIDASFVWIWFAFLLNFFFGWRLSSFRHPKAYFRFRRWALGAWMWCVRCLNKLTPVQGSLNYAPIENLALITQISII